MKRMDKWPMWYAEYDDQFEEGPMVSTRVRVTSRRSVISAAPVPGIAVALISILLLGGCAFGQRLSYGDTVARIDASGTIPVAVTAHDQRKLITSGRENPTFVGELRSLYHIPYGVNTESGKSLSDDLTTVLAASLSAKGFKATPVVVSYSESPEAVVQRIALMRVDRGVVLTVSEWRTDTYFKTQLFYELELKVLDPSGKVLAQRRLAGHEVEMSGTARDAFRQKLEKLLNYPEVTQALTLSQGPATVGAPPSMPSGNDIGDRWSAAADLALCRHARAGGRRQGW
jgi:hypothetical protein